MRFIYFLFLIAGGMGAIVYSFHIVRIMGRMDWAERYFGAGGSYTAWKLIGIVMILLSFWVLVHGV